MLYMYVVFSMRFVRSFAESCKCKEILIMVIIVIPHCVAKSRNSAGLNFCTRSLKTTMITWHLHAPVHCCGQTGKVPLYKVKGCVSRYRFDGATKEISIHLSNIDTTIYMLIFLSHCRVPSFYWIKHEHQIYQRQLKDYWIDISLIIDYWH